MAQIFMRSMLWQADQIFAVSSLSTLGVASGPIFMWSMLSQADQFFAVSSLSTLWVANGPNLYVEHAVTGWPNLSCIFTVHIVGSQWPKSLCGACCDRLTISLLYLHCPHCGYPMAQIFMWSMLWQADHVFAVSSLSTLGKASGQIFMWSMLSQADQVFAVHLHCPHCGYPMVQIFMWSMLWQADHFFAVSSLSILWVASGPNLYVAHAVTGWPKFAVSSLSTMWVANVPHLYVEHAVTGWPCLCDLHCPHWVASGPNLYLEHAKTGRSCLCCIFTVHTVGSQ